jgi:Leucine-rich repeat (LRR) protein
MYLSNQLLYLILSKILFYKLQNIIYINYDIHNFIESILINKYLIYTDKFNQINKLYYKKFTISCDLNRGYKIDNSNVISQLNIYKLNLFNNSIILNNLFIFKNVNILNLNYSKINNVSIFKNVKILHLYNCKNINDDSGIDKLINLKQLELYNINISDKCKLNKLTNLKQLSLHRNNVITNTFLSNLCYIHKLDLSGCNNINNIYRLENKNILHKLDLYGCEKINDNSGISSLVNIWNLNLSYTNITDNIDIYKLINLRELYLENCFLNDYSILNKLYNLHTLDLSRTYIIDISIFNNTKIKKLNLSYTDIYDIPKSIYIKELDLTGCYKIYSINTSKIPNIDRLILFMCKNLQYIKIINNLSFLDICYCENLINIIEG